MGADAFFALASAKSKKSAKARKKQSAKRAEREFAVFPTTHNGNPISELKSAQHGVKQGSLVRCTVQYDRGEETEVKRQKGRDRGEKTEGKTEGKDTGRDTGERQRGESEG